uniref:Putative HNH homing endonuclease n=1 Tax=Chloromonas perforata TaxID=51730 RepID=A0A0S2LP08_9CHLO|nr:putative HNH homing endonuclease [Chloromonas perforata]ALO63170.1 putative HNH homing endonuclease [Chloromonas perforata]
MKFDGIETLSHLALHYLVSSKHGGRRKPVRARIKELNLEVKRSLYKGVFGVSKTPVIQHWPTKYYEKRVGPKPMVCPVCGFKAKAPQQIELHHPTDIDSGPKNNRNAEYYRTPDLKPICANCHSLHHRSGERLLKKCGKWHIRLPGNQKYQNPDDIFSDNCSETYRVQKEYFLKWHLRGPDQYKCNKCGVVHWDSPVFPSGCSSPPSPSLLGDISPLPPDEHFLKGSEKGKRDKKILSLELHHKDCSHKNSLISNLELLCPNCHKLQPKNQ